MKPLRWGVIGAGGIARRRTIPEGILACGNATLAGVFDVHGCEAIAREFETRAFTSINELLNADLDAVYIATPVHLHLEQVLLAANAGKHILCEKPLGLNVSDAQRMVEACEQAKVNFGVGLMMRFHAHHVAAREMILSGKLGTPVLGRAQLSCWYPPMQNAWRQNRQQGGGGALMDLGAHCIDLLEMFFGPATSVSCSIGRQVHAYEVEDSAIVTLEFANGAKGVVDCFFNIPDESSMNRLELYGSEGSLLAEGTIGQSPAGTMRWHPRKSSGNYDARQERSADASQDIQVNPINLYAAEIASFTDACLTNKPCPVNGRAGLRNQTLLTACYESAAAGKTVRVPTT